MPHVLTRSRQVAGFSAQAYFIDFGFSGVLEKADGLVTGGGTVTSLNKPASLRISVGSAQAGNISIARFSADTTIEQSVDDGASYLSTQVFSDRGQISSRLRFDRIDHTLGWVFYRGSGISTTDEQDMLNTMTGLDGSFSYPPNSSWMDFHGDFAPIKYAVTQDKGVTWDVRLLGYACQWLPTQITAQPTAVNVYIYHGTDASWWNCGGNPATGFILQDTLLAPVQIIGYAACTGFNTIGTVNFQYHPPQINAMCVPLHDGSHCYAIYDGHSDTHNMAANGIWKASYACPVDFSGRPVLPAEVQFYIYKFDKSGTYTHWDFSSSSAFTVTDAIIYNAEANPTNPDKIWMIADDSTNSSYALYEADYGAHTVTPNGVITSISYNDYVDLAVTNAGTILVFDMDGSNAPPTYLYVYRSTNGGVSFSTIDLTALIPTSYYNLNADVALNGTPFFNVGERVFWSKDDGATWDYSGLILTPNVRDLAGVGI